MKYINKVKFNDKQWLILILVEDILARILFLFCKVRQPDFGGQTSPTQQNLNSKSEIWLPYLAKLTLSGPCPSELDWDFRNIDEITKVFAVFTVYWLWFLREIQLITFNDYLYIETYQKYFLLRVECLMRAVTRLSQPWVSVWLVITEWLCWQHPF